MHVVKTFGLFVVTALAEIAGCYLPYLWLRQGRSAWLLAPGAVSLALFAWLLSLHPMAAGRTYAAYGGVYVAVALLWLWRIDAVRPDRWDLLGAAMILMGGESHRVWTARIVNRIGAGTAKSRFQKIIARVGASPPQYANPEELE